MFRVYDCGFFSEVIGRNTVGFGAATAGCLSSVGLIFEICLMGPRVSILLAPSEPSFDKTDRSPAAFVIDTMGRPNKPPVVLLRLPSGMNETIPRADRFFRVCSFCRSTTGRPMSSTAGAAALGTLRRWKRRW